MAKIMREYFHTSAFNEYLEWGAIDYDLRLVHFIVRPIKVCFRIPMVDG
jgi:hypothetical protein